MKLAWIMYQISQGLDLQWQLEPLFLLLNHVVVKCSHVVQWCNRCSPGCFCQLNPMVVTWGFPQTKSVGQPARSYKSQAVFYQVGEGERRCMKLCGRCSNCVQGCDGGTISIVRVKEGAQEWVHKRHKADWEGCMRVWGGIWEGWHKSGQVLFVANKSYYFW